MKKESVAYVDRLHDQRIGREIISEFSLYSYRGFSHESICEKNLEWLK
jgi:hypothetical protein